MREASTSPTGGIYEKPAPNTNLVERREQRLAATRPRCVSARAALRRDARRRAGQTGGRAEPSAAFAAAVGEAEGFAIRGRQGRGREREQIEGRGRAPAGDRPVHAHAYGALHTRPL